MNASTLGGPGFVVIPAADAAGISHPAMALGAQSQDLDRGDLNESIGCEVGPAGTSDTKTWTALMAVTGYGSAASGPRCRSCPLPRDRGRPDRRARLGAHPPRPSSSRPRVPGLTCASAWEATRRCPLARPRYCRLSRCTSARALGHARGRAQAPPRPVRCNVTRRSSGPAKTTAPHLPSVAWATSPLTWRCTGRPKTAAGERQYVRETRF